MKTSVLTLTNFKLVVRVLSVLLFPAVSFAQPANDDCSNAKLITTRLTCTTGTSQLTGETLAGATASATAPATTTCPNGTGAPAADIWYKFKANSTSPTITLSNNGTELRKNNERVTIQLLSNSCSGASVACTRDNVATFSLLASGLTVGQDYYVRIATSVAAPTGTGWTFDICITDPPPTNDDCSGAISLTSGTGCTPVTGNMYAASSSTAPAPCSGSVVYDEWYSFIAQTTNPTITLGAAGTDITSPGLQLFSGSCTGLTSRFCGTNSIVSSGLTIGNTYYIRVYASAGTAPVAPTNASFTICVTDPPPSAPSNDDCANATGLTLGTGKSGTVWGATNSSISTVCSGTPDDDVWYTFTPTATSATIALSGLGTNLSTSGAMLQVFSGSCGSLNAIACGTGNVTVLGLKTGTVYYVRVYSSGSGSIGGTSAGSAFTITVTGPGALTQTNVGSGRMNEVFRQTTLGSLNYPWEVTYGPDNNLWITESKGYKVYKMDPNSGAKNMVLDISQNSTFFSAPDNSFNCQFANGSGAQGGLAGLALHPNFLDGTVKEKNYVYVSYIYSQTDASHFTNRLVRFTFNPATNLLESPVSICDTLPGSNDHNSQRVIIAPVVKDGTRYLFYAAGDMGAGQFDNRLRTQKAQIPAAYEGKILRFNLEPDTDANPWIPDDNPYSSSSAVYSIGVRNNQGFAYDTALNILYGSSHGPYSDDEINIIERRRNYGHPLVIGYASDGNYNGNTTQGTSTSVSAGAAYTDNSGVSSCPPIGNEMTNKATLDANGNGLYKDPLFSAYAVSQSTVTNIWQTNPGNGGWPSEGWSGLDLYANSMIPGWTKSLVAASLKWGRLVRIRLGSSGTITIPSNSPTNNAGDTISYFGSQNRFRDLAFSPNGKDIFVVMDNSSTTSGPGSANPVVPSCMGCVQKYTFLGYNVNNGSGNRSYIPTSIDIAPGKTNAFETANQVVINAANNNTNLWVPITDVNSNIVAEIYAQGRSLDTVTTTIYTKTGTSRIANGKKYLNRHLTISPQKQPGGSVLIRLYISKAEYDQLVTDGGVSSIGNLKIIKNGDSATTVISSATTLVNTSISEAFGSNGYVLQGDISGFSSFYFAPDIVVPLPLQLLTFKGSLQNNEALLEWETANEINTSHFEVERSIDGSNFSAIGTVAAAGRSTATLKYSYIDTKATHQAATKLYYRLKQVDEDGSFSYSKTIVIELSNVYTVSIHPNPITDVLNIRLSLSKAQRVHISVTDMNGRAVYNSSKLVTEGSNTLQINAKSWPAQMYSIKIIGSDNKPIATQSVIKL